MPFVRTEGGSRTGCGETLRSNDRAGRTSDELRVLRGASQEASVPAQRPSPAPDELEPFESFLPRHVGTSEEEQAGMLKVLGYESLDELIDRRRARQRAQPG